MTAVTIYGSSDDLIEVDGGIREEFTYSDFAGTNGHGDYLAFSDGTVLNIMFSGSGVWRITPVVRGTGTLNIEQASEGDDSNYSDKATLSDADWVVQGNAMARAVQNSGSPR